MTWYVSVEIIEWEVNAHEAYYIYSETSCSSKGAYSLSGPLLWLEDACLWVYGTCRRVMWKVICKFSQLTIRDSMPVVTSCYDKQTRNDENKNDG